MKNRRSLAEFFGLRRNLVILLIAIFAIGAGEELWMRFIPKYLQALGATVFVIGAFDALGLLGAIYAYAGGIVVIAGAFTPLSSLSTFFPSWLRSCSRASVGRGDLPDIPFSPWTCFSLPASFSLIAETEARPSLYGNQD
jgi:hypothetical protein